MWSRTNIRAAGITLSLSLLFFLPSDFSLLTRWLAAVSIISFDCLTRASIRIFQVVVDLNRVQLFQMDRRLTRVLFVRATKGLLSLSQFSLSLSLSFPVPSLLSISLRAPSFSLSVSLYFSSISCAQKKWQDFQARPI